MYSNSKEQINLEKAYRSVHVESVQQEGLDFETLSQAATTIGHGYKAIYDAFLTNPDFHDKMLTYWIGPAIAVAVGALAKNGFDKAHELTKKYLDKRDNVEKERLTKELLKDDEVLIILDKLCRMDKEHQHNTAQYINFQRSLAHKIETYLKEHSPHMAGKVRSGGVWSTYRKQTSFD